MDEDFVDEENPYNEAGREDLLENDEFDSSEEGFLKGYDEEETADAKAPPAVEDDEKVQN